MCCGKMIRMPRKENEMGKILTTRDIDVSRVNVSKKLKQKTTKDIEVSYLGEGEPLKPATGPMVTTHNIEEFQKKAKKKKSRKKKK